MEYQNVGTKNIYAMSRTSGRKFMRPPREILKVIDKSNKHSNRFRVSILAVQKEPTNSQRN